jgi:hypothetical protein
MKIKKMTKGFLSATPLKKNPFRSKKMGRCLFRCWKQNLGFFSLPLLPESVQICFVGGGGGLCLLSKISVTSYDQAEQNCQGT